jgi:hypothetical protein
LYSHIEFTTLLSSVKVICKNDYGKPWVVRSGMKGYFATTLQHCHVKCDAV